MTRQASLVSLFLLVSVPFIALGQLYRSTVSPPELHESVLGLRNGLSVLTLAMSPGDEDFDLVTDLRERRGAAIMSSYATNGEAGESDVALGYPGQLAARLRVEASRAMEVLRIQVFFLNFPEIGASRDTAAVYTMWDRDSVETALMRLISLQRPHLIVLFPERGNTRPSVPWEVMKACLLSAVQRLKPPSSVHELSRSAGISTWSVQRVVVGSATAAGSSRKGAKNSARKARAQYRSLWQQLAEVPEFAYAEIFPQKKSVKSVDRSLPQLGRTRLRSLVSRVNELATQVSGSPAKLRREEALRAVSSLTDSVDFLIATQYTSLSHLEQKTLVLWKEALQDIRNRLLDITVSYSLSEQVLAPRQLTYLNIDSVGGIDLPPELWLYFPSVKNGWIINETADERTPLKQGQYRLVSPGAVPYNLPAALDGLDKPDVHTLVNLYIVGSGRDRTKNVAMKLPLPIQFAQKFTVEPLTPVVRAIDGEYVVVRLTNHSRDGVRSQIWVNDSLVTSQPVSFRLHEKEAIVTDTLRLSWHRPPEGTYLEKMTIEGIPVARFAARSFDVAVDTSKRIGLVTTFSAGATAETLRRLRVRYDQIEVPLLTEKWLAAHDVVILDRRLLSLDSTVRSRIPDLKLFAAHGGHLIVLAQDAESWNQFPLVGGVRLEPSSAFDAMAEVAADSTDSLLISPNKIQPEDWTQWLWYRAYNKVDIEGSGVTIPFKDRTSGSAFVVRSLEGKGTITYVDLALPPQWLNIHIGAFRLFANLLSS